MGQSLHFEHLDSVHQKKIKDITCLEINVYGVHIMDLKSRYLARGRAILHFAFLL